MDSFAYLPAVRVAGDLEASQGVSRVRQMPLSTRSACRRHRWTPAACGTQPPRVSPDHKAPQVHREPKASKASRVGKVNGA